MPSVPRYNPTPVDVIEFVVLYKLDVPILHPPILPDEEYNAPEVSTPNRFLTVNTHVF